MGTKEVYRKKLDQSGNPVIENGDFVMELVESKHEDDLPELPDWLGLEQSLRYSALFGKAYATADAKGLNLFMITLLNGKRGEASENALAFAFQNIGVSWTDEEKAELNNYLKTYHFTIKL